MQGTPALTPAAGAASFVCIEDAVPKDGVQCLPGRMYSTPQPFPDQSPQYFAPLPRAPAADPELPLPDLMQLGSSTLTDWLLLLLVITALALAYMVVRRRRRAQTPSGS